MTNSVGFSGYRVTGKSLLTGYTWQGTGVFPLKEAAKYAKQLQNSPDYKKLRVIFKPVSEIFSPEEAKKIIDKVA